MKRFLLATLLLVGFTTASRTSDAAEKVVPSKLASPVTVRFAGEQASEVPDFQRHVSPLLGKLGCNGRACHGSFQGRGGFRLSLFGYDFKMDHLALTKAVDDKQGPRVSVENPLKSLMIEKPTEVVDHEGGLRLKTGTWEFQLLHRWIAGGAKGPAKDAPRMLRLEVSPTELVFEKAGLKNRGLERWDTGRRDPVDAVQEQRRPGGGGHRRWPGHRREVRRYARGRVLRQWRGAGFGDPARVGSRRRELSGG